MSKIKKISNWFVFLFGLSVIIAHLIMSESMPIHIVFLAWLNGFLLAVITANYVFVIKKRKECR